MYDPCGIGVRLRTYVFVSLGTWHTYKHASLLVYKRFADVFMAGIFHALYPNSIFFPKPRLAACTQMFVFIRMAYPEFRDDITEALTHVHTLRPQSKICLENLRDLCEYFIPTVW
jgi:hypothetical protein